MEQTYAAVRIRQTAASEHLVLFAARATEVEDWGGVPQRERLGGGETAGFQREENEDRLDELKRFFGDPKNVIQNPLLCALRDNSKVSFHASDASGGPVEAGELKIEWEDLTEWTLLDLLNRLGSSIADRLPELDTADPGEETLMKLRERIASDHPDLNMDEPAQESTDDEDETAEEADDAATSVLFTDETHIVDFWREVRGRAAILEEIEPARRDELTEFLGFSKEVIISFLQPIIIVDGQHRLRGSLLAAETAVSEELHRAEIRAAIDDGDDPDVVSDRIRRRESRQLPISLLMDPSPAEHVFQFVVVNQKATPIGKALLGTIVSTSLTSDELEVVSNRLKASGIPLEDSQAIAYLTRHPESPFYDLVEKGLADDRRDVLQWNVLGILIRIFRELSGGKLFHERIDHADKWRRNYLDSSDLVAGGADTAERLKIWSEPGGPWRDVFIAFYSAVRDQLGETTEPSEGNYWGSPRTSNLFNKVSLTILAADFFQFLCDRGLTIDRVDQVGNYVTDWLGDVKRSYFSRDWKLSGVKKDSTAIKAQWSFVWVQYRKDPVRLPPVAEYRKNRAT
jgi:hypothetical protein